MMLTSLSTQAQNDTLIVGYTNAPPFIINENDRLEGISIWLWEQCAKELKLKYELRKMTFSEMLDSVKTGGIDISINPLTITSERLSNINFTHAFYASQSIVTRQHLSPFTRLKNFLKSFFSLSFLSGFLALVFLVGTFGFLEWYFERKVNPQHFRTGWKGIWDGLWWSVVTMTTVGYGDKTPQSRGGKIVALVWMFSGLLFISGLTASIASTLTVDRLASDLTNLADFKNRPIGTIKYTSSETHLRQLFFKNIQTFPSVSAGLDALYHHKIEAFIYDEPIVRYSLKKEEKYQELVVLPEKFRMEFYAFGLPKKHHELSNLISHKLLELTERGTWQEVLNEYGCGEE